MLQNRTTYYLGAGASYNALPLANGLKEDIKSFLNLLDPQNGTSDVLQMKFSSKLYLKYKQVIEDIDSFPTVDSFAKALHERGNRIGIQRIAELISLYFLFKQFDCTRLLKDSGKNLKSTELKPFKGSFDSRYLSFLGKIYTGGQLNQNLNIITWNYDTQLEIALSKYLGIDFYNACSLLNMYPSHNRDNFVPDNNKHRIVKLNGSAGLWYSGYNSNQNLLQNNVDLEALLRLSENDNNLLTTVAHAWDNSKIQANAIEYANQIMRQTENLVIIGYSFPDFNWELDSEIFKNASARRIYVQVRDDDFPQIEYKLKDLVRPVVSIEKYSFLDEFYLPIHARKNRINFIEPMEKFNGRV